MVATTIRTIRTERRRRMADPNAPTAQHLAASWTSLRRALTRFRSSAYQQGVVTGGGQDRALVRSALANALLSHLNPAPFWDLSADEGQQFLYLLFFLRSSGGNPGPGGAGSVTVKLNVGTHAAAISWVASMAHNSARTTEAVASYHGLVNGLRQAQIRAFLPVTG